MWLQRIDIEYNNDNNCYDGHNSNSDFFSTWVTNIGQIYDFVYDMVFDWFLH